MLHVRHVAVDMSKEEPGMPSPAGAPQSPTSAPQPTTAPRSAPAPQPAPAPAGDAGSADDSGSAGDAGSAAHPKAGAWALVGLIIAVSTTTIDQTIVALSAPAIQSGLDLTRDGVQWAVNASLLATAVTFLPGGRLADLLGHRRMALVGITWFGAASPLCGLAPTGAQAGTWLVGARALQGVGCALMFPAAIGLVVRGLPRERRGRAMALLFAVTGAMTSVGPLAGGYLTEWTWRAVFWVNVPLAALAGRGGRRDRHDRDRARLPAGGLLGLDVAGRARAPGRRSRAGAAVRRAGAQVAGPAGEPGRVRRPRLHRLGRGDAAVLDRVRSGLLLPQRLRPGVPAAVRAGHRTAVPEAVRGLRDHLPDRLDPVRPARREAGGRPGRDGRRGRLHAEPGEHRRGQPRPRRLLRRGHRDLPEDDRRGPGAPGRRGGGGRAGPAPGSGRTDQRGRRRDVDIPPRDGGVRTITARWRG
ncbi:export protein [Actinosynnema pretiosum subsp. pretiosum]|nr:export protein [Actinosynnema pretiosum subsp. pretiosum]